MRSKTLAIPIRRVDFSDTSQVVSFLTRDVGVVDGIAKGAYRLKSAFQGPFDLLTLNEIVYLETRGVGLAIITEATQLDGFRGLRQVWINYVAAAYVLEFLRAVSVPGEPTPELFDLACATFSRLSAPNTEKELTRLLLSFELRAYRYLGLSAEIRQCGACGRSWPAADRPVYFSPEIAGILCTRCRASTRPRKGLLVPGRVLRRMNRLAAPICADGPGVLDASAPGPNFRPDDEVRLRKLLSQLRSALLERRFEMSKYTARFF